MKSFEYTPLFDTAPDPEGVILFDLVSPKYRTPARGLNVFHLKLVFVFLGRNVDMLIRKKYPVCSYRRMRSTKKLHTFKRKTETTPNIIIADVRVSL